MTSLLKKLVLAPWKASKSGRLARTARALRINRILLRLHGLSLRLFLVHKYGPGFLRRRTGEMTIRGTTFAFYDPGLVYLPAAAMGEVYEAAVTRHMETVLGSGRLAFLDIGAHYGIYTAYVGKLNADREIHAFEPNAEFFEILRENIRINGVHATAHRVALSDSAGAIPFSGRTMKTEGKSDVETVESITFDELREREGIEPDVAKIDVHGAEGKVLFGMKRALKERIRHVYCELHPDELLVGYTNKEVLDILIESGFELFEFDWFRSGSGDSMKPVTGERYEKLADQDTWTDREIHERRMIYAVKRARETAGSDPRPPSASPGP
ncbi:MAG: FkbM family methyltransferase [Candidatus Eisenbacteria bacterium]